MKIVNPVLGMRCHKCKAQLNCNMVLPPSLTCEQIAEFLTTVKIYCLCDKCLESDPEFFAAQGTDRLIFRERR